jgi:regulatory protein
MKPRNLSKEQVLSKIKHYCAYQERYTSEVREKLFSFDLDNLQVEEVINQLVSGNFLNEERFAVQYAGSKFRLKKWGKIKIKHALRQRQVSAKFIKQAIAQIEEADYLKTLNKLAETKRDSLKGEKDMVTRQRKIRDYLLQKGYEPELINNISKQK